jgi:hypothetical protein
MTNRVSHSHFRELARREKATQKRAQRAQRRRAKRAQADVQRHQNDVVGHGTADAAEVEAIRGEIGAAGGGGAVLGVG